MSHVVPRAKMEAMESGEKLLLTGVLAYLAYQFLKPAPTSASLGYLRDVNNGIINAQPAMQRQGIQQNTGLPVGPATASQTTFLGYGTMPVGDQVSDATFARQVTATQAASSQATAQLQANEQAGAAQFAEQHTTAVYCGPGCYDYYDSKGTLVSRGDRGQSAGSLLAQVAGGVSGLGW